MSNIQTILSKGANVETTVFNRDERLLSEILNIGGEYLVEYFKINEKGRYIKENTRYYTASYAVALLAAQAFAAYGVPFDACASLH